MKVRRATEDDVPSVVRIINAAYRVEDFFVRGDRTDDADVRGRMASTDGCFLVAEDEDDAMMAASWVEVRDGRGYFGMLSVDPALQGKGVGKAFVREIENYCRERNCRDLDLQVVNLREELPAFYVSIGFKQIGTLPFDKPEKLTREAHFVRMTKAL